MPREGAKGGNRVKSPLSGLTSIRRRLLRPVIGKEL